MKQKLSHHLVCHQCKNEYSITNIFSYCPKCAFGTGDLGYVFEISSQYAENVLNTINRFKTSSILLKYASLLPFELDLAETGLPDVTMTPLHKCQQISLLAQMNQVWMKDETRNLTCSIKDRASYVGILAAKHINHRDLVVTASTGNQAISVAAYAAATQLSSIVFVSQNASKEKLEHIRRYGAEIKQIAGTYDDAYDACLQFTEQHLCINKSAGCSPLCLEGMKTTAYEICEQLNWDAPKYVFVPVGDGTVLASLAKGFIEFFQLGLIGYVPRMVGVQSSSCNPAMIEYYERGQSNHFTAPDSAHGNIGQSQAESISVNIPRDKQKLFRALDQTKGALIDVEDSLMKKMQTFLAQKCGLYLELASCSVLAGLLKAKETKLCQTTDACVLVLTGGGFKGR